MSQFLFEDFEFVSPKAWKQKIQADLKGADYNETLLWENEERITVRPFYTQEDRTNRTINLPKKGFNICQTLFVDDEKVANKLALDALDRGANAIQFQASKKFDYKTLLEGINIQKTTIYFKLDFLEVDFTKELNSFCNSKNCFLQIDSLGKLAATGNWYASFKEDTASLSPIVNDCNNSIVVSASLYQNSGATIVQQLAYALAHANEYITLLGADDAAKIHFHFAVGSNYFFEIAKLRAFRILYATLLEEYGITEHTAHIFVQPSTRNKTIFDYNVNMLRTTSECMSAILGGADTVSNISYDHLFHKSNEFGERISRNQLLILQQESYLQEAQNFADGAYYIENITEQLAEQALIIFKQLEKGGGFLQQLRLGNIQKKIAESASNEQTMFNEKKLLLLGSNHLPNDKESLSNDLEIYPFLKSNHSKTAVPPIIKRRLTEAYEKHRLDKELKYDKENRQN